MNFTSITFAGFFLVTLALYWLARRQAWQNSILLVASYIFYGWLNPWYGVLLGLSTTADFFIALGISRYRGYARAFLTLSLILNLGVLAFFKYYNFFNVGLSTQLAQIGIHTDVILVSILLPAGLSFYTLRKLAYILDVSRGALQPVENFVDFALYVSFFPQIVAGPIERIQKLMPQIQAPRIWKQYFFSAAWPLLVMGLFKKIVIADTMKSIVDRIFSIQEPSKALVLVAALGFTLQILADFSGYTDMARGIALLFGFETSENFNHPYLALTPSDFWNRWHITLSNFLRDYIFFPLRRALLKKRTLPAWLVQSAPPLVTMFVSGLWHGAGWTYLVWGIYYGLLIVIYQSSGIQFDWKQNNKLKLLVAWLVMFSLIVFGWFLFRAPSMDWAGRVLFQAAWLTGSQDLIIGLVALSMLAVYSFPLILKLLLDRFSKPDSWWQAAYFALLTIAVIVYTNSSNSDFIYFQF
jgi:D-alanyl-lipoteichoic acid acyltransferase DltB (MBOAT superfamily)